MTEPVWDLNPGRFVEYVYLDVKVQYDTASMNLSCSEPRTPIPTPWTGTTRFRMSNTDGFQQMRPCTMRLNGLSGGHPGGRLGGLYNGVVRAPGLPPYYGEIGGAGAFSDPGQPIVTVSPVAGEQFTVTVIAKVYNPDGSWVVSAFPCRYMTEAVGVQWGDKSNCTITRLMERSDIPGMPGCIGYRYVFWEGWLVDIMCAIYMPDGTVLGRQFYGVEWG